MQPAAAGEQRRGAHSAKRKEQGAGWEDPLSERYPRGPMRVASVGGGMSGQGSTGNVIAALASFFIPGLGQLVQGRPLKALIMFVLAAILWYFLLGWIVHLWSILDAALWKPKP